MRILALDTATENCSAALLIDGALVTRDRRLDQGHATHILAMVDELLGQTGIRLQELDAIAFGRGPGAFTGVRLAAGVTQGLAFGAGIPVVPVSDLRALAQRVLDVEVPVDRVLICNDARMREIYWGCYERRDGRAVPVGDEQVSGPRAVRLPDTWNCDAEAQVGAAVPLTARALYGAGSGFAAYPDLRRALGARLNGLSEDLLPRATEIATLAAAEVAAGHVLPADQALPVYLRDKVVCPAPGSH